MKKILTSLLSIMAILACVCGFSACSTKVSFKLNFVVDNAIYATIDTSGDEIITLPDNPTKENYTFDGWYWDKDTWQQPFTANSLLDAPLSSNMSVYAKFTLNTINGVSFEDVETTYDGTQKAISVCNLPNGATVSYDKSNTYVEAGTYTITATVKQDNYEDLSLIATLTINKATYDMSGVKFENKTVTYNGESHSITASNLPKGVSVTYENNGKVNVGTYTITAKFTGDSKNYEAIPNKTATLKIEKVNVEKPLQDNTSFVYNGKGQTYAVVENSCYDINGNKQTDAGNYTVIISLKDKNNYQWKNKTTEDITYSFKINKATYDMSSVKFENRTVTYNGESHSITASNLPKGVSVTYENNGKVTVGTYTITAKFTGDNKNYEAIPDKTATLKILDIVINFVVDDDIYHSESIAGKNNILLPANPIKKGYSFDGWFFDKNTWARLFTADNLLTDDMTVYAKFTAIAYCINYDLNGGTNATNNPATYTVENNITLSAPTKVGYTFVSWSNGDTIKKGSTGNKSFTAQWEICYYTARFYISGDLVGQSKFTVEDTTIENIPDIPFKKGYTAKWENCTVTPCDININAIYIINKYTVTWKNYDGSILKIDNDVEYRITTEKHPKKLLILQIIMCLTVGFRLWGK